MVNTEMRDWLLKSTQEQREQVAAEADTSVEYLWQISGGHRNPSKKLAERLEAATNGELNKVRLLFPDSSAA